MNKKAFTLIEVLVSVVILSTVAVMLFEISTNSKNNFSFLSSKASFTTLASLPLMQNDIKYHNSDKTLFEYVKYDFDIKDDELRKYLKEQKVHYDQEEFTTFSPFDNKDENSNEDLEDENTEENIMKFAIIFDKIIIRDKQNSTFSYKLDIQ
jgi:prepilin-type N-terminal cleavage/methylation domain-containing protein